MTAAVLARRRCHDCGEERTEKMPLYAERNIDGTRHRKVPVCRDCKGSKRPHRWC